MNDFMHGSYTRTNQWSYFFRSAQTKLRYAFVCKWKILVNLHLVPLNQKRKHPDNWTIYHLSTHKALFPFFYCLFLHFVSVLISRFREADVEKSLLLLQILIDQSKDEQLLRLYVEKIKCLLKKSQLKDVLSSVNDLCCLLDRAKEFKKSWQHSYHNFDSDLFTVLSELQTKNAWKTTMMLVRCLLQVSILYYDGQKLYERLRLLMLKVTSFPNKIIIEKSNSFAIITNKKFNDKFQVLEEIIQAAQEISEVSSVSKAIHLAFMMHRLGEEQEKVHDYVNSSASYAKAINLIETEQNYIARISPLGDSFHNLGRVLERRKKNCGSQVSIREVTSVLWSSVFQPHR